MDKKNILTYEGLKKLEDELQDLKVVKRKEVAQKIKEAREQGDLSENAEYDAAKEAQAHMFLRCVREEDLQQELAEIRKIADEYGVEIQEVLRDYCRPSSFEDRPFQVLEGILHENFPDVIVAPFLLTAGTDARRFSDLADSILRFAPIDLNKQQFSSIHGKNENITIQNIGQCVLFYKDFIKQI